MARGVAAERKTRGSRAASASRLDVEYRRLAKQALKARKAARRRVERGEEGRQLLAASANSRRPASRSLASPTAASMTRSLTDLLAALAAACRVCSAVLVRRNRAFPFGRRVGWA